jgi:hypothetical protein
VPRHGALVLLFLLNLSHLISLLLDFHSNACSQQQLINTQFLKQTGGPLPPLHTAYFLTVVMGFPSPWRWT